MPANVAMAVATLVYGLFDHRTLFIAFSFVGLITGIGQLRYWLRAPTTHRHWWFVHMGGMLGSCIAALTALVVVNASRFGTRTFATTIWIAVPAVGIPAIFAWTAYYPAASPRAPRSFRDGPPRATAIAGDASDRRGQCGGVLANAGRVASPRPPVLEAGASRDIRVPYSTSISHYESEASVWTGSSHWARRICDGR